MTRSLVVHRVRVPFRTPFATAARTWRVHEAWIVELRAPDGRRGVGEAVLEDAADAPELERLLAAWSAGIEPEASTAAGRALLAAAGAARLDLASRAPTGWVGVNATIPGADPETAGKAAARATEAGYRTLKLKAGADEATDVLVARLRAVRAAAGEGPALRLDVNASWDLDTATERLSALDDVGLQYVEQPLAAGALADAAELRRRVGVPVAADEAVESEAAARAILDARAADVLVVKPARVGGPRVVATIAELAADAGVPVVVSSLFETGIGLAAALACAVSLPDVPGWPAAERDHGLATADLLEDDLVVEPLEVAAGRIRAPGGSDSGGLGVRPDDAAIGRYRVTGP